MLTQLQKIQIALTAAKEKENTMAEQLDQLRQLLAQETQRLNLLQQYQYEFQQQQEVMNNMSGHEKVVEAENFLITIANNIRRQELRVTELNEACERQQKLWQHYNQKTQSFTILIERLQMGDKYIESEE